MKRIRMGRTKRADLEKLVPNAGGAAFATAKRTGTPVPVCVRTAAAASGWDLRTYLTDVVGMSKSRSDEAIRKLEAHPDVHAVFAAYVGTGVVPEGGPVVLGHTAASLAREYPLTALGACNYLIYLRENPAEAQANLKAGLPRK